MTAENEELENNLHEEAPKTLATFRERLAEKRREEDEDTEITIRHSDDGDKKDKDEKKGKKPPYAKKDYRDDDEDDDGDDGKKNYKAFSPKNEADTYSSMSGYTNGKPGTTNAAGTKGSPGTQSGGGSIVKGRTGEADVYREGGKKKVKEDMNIDEETQAASTLHPKGAKGEPLDMSRVEMMKHMVTHMSGLNKTDFTDWFKKSLDRWGPNKDHGVGDVAGKNMASIDSKLAKGPKTKDPMPKLNVREDLDEILGETELSEEILEKTATLFEAAVHARCVMETVRIEEEYVEILAEEIEHFTTTTLDKLDMYLNYAVENWMGENRIAVDSALRTEITTEFIDGMKALFAEHYIDVPEDKVNVLEAMADKVEILEDKVENLLSENTLLKDAVIGGAKQEIIEHVGKELTQAQMEKFATLAEGIDFDGDFDTYANKLNIVKENYFSSQSKKAPTSNILEESFEGEEDKPTVNHFADPAVNRYAAAITQTVGKVAAQR